MLAAGAERVVLTRPPSGRALDPERLLAHVASGVVEPRPELALELALQSGHGVVVCGPLYLVGALRGELRRRLGAPLPAVEIPTYDPSAATASRPSG